MGKHKRKRNSTTSSGRRRGARMMRNIRKFQMKVNRWDRYKEEIEKEERKGNPSRWDTSGLKRHIELLEKLL